MKEEKNLFWNGKTKTIRISGGLYEAMEQALNTERARLLGFRFLSDIINSAVRELLMKYEFLEILKVNDEEHRE